ncbi:ribbon-helix-helix domain-containing protein [Allostreptomyces psammosilenae]|uniref:Ribbon-helix-helix protein CopG domain-containing protein n=1 Tax=Allostreptomyces psammosilenae TaxID=1892865 RepID=A0A853ACN5_9ACTN|nr:CopG family transcriptional regulator [Allostreptomyces psammosilenae]NYI08122.1 hypothetical protein [Allostreptomyces psammosilenae]
MGRITFTLDDAVHVRVQEEARRRGMSAAAWVRERIAAYLPASPPPPAGRRVFHAMGIGGSGRSDISERMEEILAGYAEGRDILREEEERQRRGPAT